MISPGILSAASSSTSNFSFINHVGAVPGVVAAKTITTTAIDSTGANLIIVFVTDFPDTAATIGTTTDSKGNVYSTAITNKTAHQRASIFYCISPVVGSGHTFTYSTNPNSSYCQIHVLCFSKSGIVAPMLDQVNSNISSVATSSITTGSITPSVNGSLIITGFGGYPRQFQPTISGGGFVNSDQIDWRPYQPNLYSQMALYYRLQSLISVCNPTHIYGSTNTNVVSVIASFK